MSQTIAMKKELAALESSLKRMPRDRFVNVATTTANRLREAEHSRDEHARLVDAARVELETARAAVEANEQESTPKLEAAKSATERVRGMVEHTAGDAELNSMAKAKLDVAVKHLTALRDEIAARTQELANAHTSAANKMNAARSDYDAAVKAANVCTQELELIESIRANRGLGMKSLPIAQKRKHDEEEEEEEDDDDDDDFADDDEKRTKRLKADVEFIASSGNDDDDDDEVEVSEASTSATSSAAAASPKKNSRAGRKSSTAAISRRCSVCKQEGHTKRACPKQKNESIMNALIRRVHLLENSHDKLRKEYDQLFAKISELELFE